VSRGAVAAVAGVIISAVMITWLLRVRSRSRITLPQCRRCGYQVVGLTGGSCPECGTELRPENIRLPGEDSSHAWIRLGMLTAALLFLASFSVGIESVWRWAARPAAATGRSRDTTAPTLHVSFAGIAGPISTPPRVVTARPGAVVTMTARAQDDNDPSPHILVLFDGNVVSRFKPLTMPTAPGEYTLSFKVTDSAGNVIEESWSIQVVADR
jgi:hypothetical protein